MSLAMYLFPAERVTDPHGSNALVRVDGTNHRPAL